MPFTKENARAAALLVHHDPPELRFPSFFEKREAIDECWLWTGFKECHGYGRFWIGPKERFVRAHVYAYEALNGPLPQGQVLHHICHVKHCVRPDHLMPLTPGNHQRIHKWENRATHCPQGHPYTPENTLIRKSGKGKGDRMCRECVRIRNAAARAKRSVHVAKLAGLLATAEAQR